MQMSTARDEPPRFGRLIAHRLSNAASVPVVVENAMTACAFRCEYQSDDGVANSDQPRLAAGAILCGEIHRGVSARSG
jgi:hypothetical protein